ncbi:dihydrodipicolinate synthase family protein (plasmid) [Rhodococcus sp. ZPP]|uniref:dihydrodipicolinate synthase family protein n=1 Tax=Rhodococcus TaxID=1827 RepID=UPI001AD890FE|nr:MULTISPECIES: dihydrodipicolinate synthase family protein [Rhodococcus]MBO8150761.1 dihydrodipicolinate synthase family protein [Rhodococcus erythropolis]QTJ70939.1 dihydrodipicolinate synthase family protein [Rhodococcus sp. ZPP]
MTTPLVGIVAYPVTPFSEDGKIDTPRLHALVTKLVDDGVHAIAPLGSTGESAYLEEHEWDAVVDTTVAAVGKRLPVVVGASDLTTANTIRRAEYAQRAGANSVMVLPVSYWPLSDREIKAHYKAISDAIDIPIMVYNNPATSGIDMRPELLAELFETVDNVTMIKESTGDITRMNRIKALTDGELPFFNGSNPLILKALQAGAAGWCTAAPCLRPQPCLDLFTAMDAGEFNRAQQIYESLRPLLEFIVAGGLPTTVKAGLDILGTKVGDPRAPLLPLDEADRTTLSDLLDSTR